MVICLAVSTVLLTVTQARVCKTLNVGSSPTVASETPKKPWKNQGFLFAKSALPLGKQPPRAIAMERQKTRFPALSQPRFPCEAVEPCPR
jgi:hypothetical protein